MGYGNKEGARFLRGSEAQVQGRGEGRGSMTESEAQVNGFLGDPRVQDSGRTKSWIASGRQIPPPFSVVGSATVVQHLLNFDNDAAKYIGTDVVIKKTRNAHKNVMSHGIYL